MPPTQEQLQAITSPVDDSLALVAVPGSGKTFVIERRIKHLIDHGVDPARILVITFSRTQSEDMSIRIFSTFPELQATPLYNGLGGMSQVTTIHGACRRILNQYNGSFDTKFTIPDWKIRAEIEKWVEYHNWTYLSEYSKQIEPVGWHSVLYWMEKAKRDSVEWGTKPLNTYFCSQGLESFALKLASCCVDFQKRIKPYWTFSDILYDMENRLKEETEFQTWCSERFTHILIDEAQDTNPQAMRIVSLMKPKSVMIVGDEDQAIYSFLGAAPQANLRDGFDTLFGGTRLKMQKNFRSQPIILKRAQRLITYNYDETTEKYKKEIAAFEGYAEGPDLSWKWFPDAEQEAHDVMQEIEDRIEQEESPGNFFVMSRTNAQIAYYELECLERGIPFVNIGASSFFNRKVPRIIMGYMQLTADPFAWDAYDSIYNVSTCNMKGRDGEYCQTRYLGREFNEHLDRKRPVLSELYANRNVKNRKGWAQWTKGVNDLISAINHLEPYDEAYGLVLEIKELILDAWMEEEYPVEEDVSDSAYEDLAVMLNLASRFTVAQMIEYVTTLQSTERVRPEDLVDYVLLGTIYRFKGLERDTVFVVGLSEGLLPHRFSLGDKIPTDGIPLPRTSTEWDERNLAYVAVTRAKTECHLSGIETWETIKDPLKPSRFVYEMGLINE